MKKIIVIVLTVISLFVFIVPSFAQGQQQPPQPDRTIYTDENGQKFQSVRGIILAIDRRENEILLREDFTDEKKIIAVPKERLQNLAVGDHVRIRVKLDTNQALKVVKIRRARSSHGTPM